MWFRWMMIAFLTNGLGAFGAGVMQNMGLKDYQYLYLSIWYAMGLAVAGMAYVAARQKIERREVIIGGLMGLCSSCGWYLLTRAFAHGMPGYLLYPISIGGSLSIVTLAGVLVFKEHLSAYGWWGILSGITAIILLATL